MRNLDFSEYSLENYYDNRFVILGDEEIIKKNISNKKLVRKLNREYRRGIDGIWGTLGFANDKPFNLQGSIQMSERGNYNPGKKHAVKREIIQDLKDVNADISSKKNPVRERFLNLSDVEFDLPKVFNYEAIPTLRLDLFLGGNQGALVYIQHEKEIDEDKENVFVEYIMCEGVDSDFSNNRDRLTYKIPIVPKHQLEHVEGEKLKVSNVKTRSNFVIKILTFKRFTSTAKETVDNAIKKLKGGNLLVDSLLPEKKYALLKFNSKINYTKEDSDGEEVLVGGKFEAIKSDKIDKNAKTLLLLHGTFSTTDNSFEHALRKNDKKASLLQKLIENEHYGQIIGFDHPTIYANAEDNVKEFLDKIKGVKFDKSIDIITTSRGALVAEQLASTNASKQHFQIDKVLMFSAAHGCGYFNIGPFLSKGLSILRRVVSNPAAKVMIAYLQNSVHYFLGLPGPKMLTPGSDEINFLIKEAQMNSSTIEFKRVVADWNKCLIADRGWVGRAASVSLDAIIKIPLGKEHDWVIGAKNQAMIPENVSTKPNPINVYSIHGSYLNENHLKDRNCKSLDPDELVMESLV